MIGITVTDSQIEMMPLKIKKIDNYWIKTESNAIFLDYDFKNLKGEEEDIALLMNKDI
ncbi:hypothetical protein H8356DRAFT_1330885 [Neocallimastix lanati (nom. inval.)]|nr:hypothetical protein H8356DRAFT_1330885 [Neocallimastix sp. JGI-2020a]